MKTRKKGFFNPLKVKELRRKMLLIIGVMFIIRLLNQIPTPGVNHDYLKQIYSSGRRIIERKKRRLRRFLCKRPAGVL